MAINTDIFEVDYHKRTGNLNVEAQSKVKSQKHFPYFQNGNNVEIFKPLSKTKPLTSPFFAYSEVFWSYVINKYFYTEAPIYKLAICKNYTEEVPKYYHHGTLVPSMISSSERIVNLYEYYQINPDTFVNINDYTNYCMALYDYSGILKSNIFSENYELGSRLAMQILLSILRGDENYHYENVSFIYEENKLSRLTPPNDHEFSAYFLYLDDTHEHTRRVMHLKMP